MQRFIRILFLFAIPTLISASEDYWQQFVHYDMNVKLNTNTHILSGTSSILYQNNSPDTLKMLYMHLYPNGYRNPQSLRAQEARKFYQEMNTDTSETGWIDITQFRILPAETEHQVNEPLTAFEIDDTILKAPLPHPLLPGEKVRIELQFDSKVRKFQGRAGRRGQQYDFAQWYPKMCVYDENGWNNVPFHLTGEFYGEFSTFDVSMDVPFENIVGATGVVTSGDPGWELVRVDTAISASDWQKTAKSMQKEKSEQAKDSPRRNVTFHAENVHDFAWITSPDFLYESGDWDGIPIHVLYNSRVKMRWSKTAAERGRRALEWLSDKFGRYPYPQLTITHGLLGGGMEYPMLVMNSSESEGLILHEVGHIYFYGILGNNETKEAWLDEGFTTFQTRWYMETRYGDWGYDRDAQLKRASWLDKKRPAVTSRERTESFTMMYMDSKFNEPISRWSYKYNDGMSYQMNAYNKGSLLYDMLRYVVGEENFTKICHSWFDRWKFKHVNEARFRAVCEEVSGMNLDWFFEEWLHGTPTVDYQLGKVTKNKLSDGSFETKVDVKRAADGIMPVEVEITLPDGSTQIQRWAGKDTEGSLVFKTNEKPDKVVLDPQNSILDKSRMGHGDMKVEFYPEYPRMRYSPSNAYVVTYKPTFWYNDVDGLRSGIRLQGHYRNTREVTAQMWYGAESQKLDGAFEYASGSSFMQNMNYSLSSGRIEGRTFAKASMNYEKGQYIFSGLRNRFSLDYIFTKLDDAAYAISEYDIDGETVALPHWSDSDVSLLHGQYSVNPRGMKWRSNMDFDVWHGNEGLGGDVNFTKLASELKFSKAGEKGGVLLRAYAGTFIGGKDNLPVQHAFSAFAESYHDQFFNSRLSRTRGAFFPEAHFQKPGGGNLRGFYDQPELLGDGLAAVNIELRRTLKIPVLDKLFIRRFLGRSEFIMFGETGTLAMLDGVDSNKTLADAGFGLYFEKQYGDEWYTLITGTRFNLRLDFPLWVNEPYKDPISGKEDEQVKFRYVVSFERAF
ncbi:MAG: M1 family metallopeptidase [Deferribacteres bacterium]|nr:M1 family metallopeptidase [candidate division KSB1 bacterium]MCB9502463.1 M1 family metallopeptidase [Deferribacteres bacterium]